LSDTTDVTSDVSTDQSAEAGSTRRRRTGSGLTAMLLPELQTMASSLGDSGWRIYANQVLTRDEDAESVGLMNLLMGKREKTERDDTQTAGKTEAADLLRQAMSFSYMRA